MSLSSDLDPIAITGFGLVSAAGTGADALWNAISARQSHLGPLKQVGRRDLSVDRGGEVPNTLLMKNGDSLSDDRAFSMAALAIEESLQRAQLTKKNCRIGLALGTALGSIQILERLVRGEAPEHLWSDVPQQSLALQLARWFGLRGPAWNFSVTCVSGLYALEQAIMDLHYRRSDAVVCGGLDTLSLFMQSGFCALKALSPTGRLRPFGKEHDGIVLGEGAAFVIIEKLSSALERDAKVYGVVAANELISDGAHLTSPDQTGRGMAEAISRALTRSGLQPDTLGCITPTATGSPIYDRMQSRAVLDALGEKHTHGVPVTTWEPVIGHALASTGILGLVHGAMVLDRNKILPSFGSGDIDGECRLQYLLENKQTFDGGAVLALTVGFGGQNGATLIARPEAIS